MKHAREQLSKTYKGIWERVANVFLVWKEFLVIYDSLDNVAIGNQIAPTFFRLVQNALWQEVDLEISRLTDQLLVAGHRTDGLRHLIELGKATDKTIDWVYLAAELNTTVAACKPIRDRRNKFLAHSDLNEKGALFIPRDQKENTANALRAIEKFMNAFEDRVGFAHTLFFEVGSSPWGSNSLMIALRKAQASRLRSHQLVRTEIDGKVRWKKRDEE